MELCRRFPIMSLHVQGYHLQVEILSQFLSLESISATLLSPSLLSTVCRHPTFLWCNLRASVWCVCGIFSRNGDTDTYVTVHPVINRYQWPRGVRPLACWYRGFESHRGHGYLSAVIVVCCQVEVSATSWSLVQRSPTDWVGVVVWGLGTSWMRRP